MVALLKFVFSSFLALSMKLLTSLSFVCSYSQFLVLCVLRIRRHYCCVCVEAMVIDRPVYIWKSINRICKFRISFS